MKYSYIDIKTFFNKAKIKMHTPRDGYNYIESAIKNKLGFVIYSNEKEVCFCWQIKNHETLLDDKLPLIRKKYPKANIKDGKKKYEWERLFIPLDQKKPLTDAIDVIKKTKNILGYK